MMAYHANPDPSCLRAGVFWGRTTGRVQLHFEFPKHQAFNVCITAGEAGSVFIWYDYDQQFWSPMPIPGPNGKT